MVGAGVGRLMSARGIGASRATGCSTGSDQRRVEAAKPTGEPPKLATDLIGTAGSVTPRRLVLVNAGVLGFSDGPCLGVLNMMGV